MLEELKAASRCLEPGVAYPMHRRFISEPLARVVTDLVPDSNRQGEKRGKAVFSVYVWKSDRATFNRPFFQEYDAWDSARSARREWRDLGAHPLRSVMDVLLWDDPQHKALHASVQEWRAKEQAQPRSIPGLMQALERGEMPEAEQPEGLNITMRPYQRQSLQFMLDCEKGEGGFRRLFWQRLVTPGGTPYWWSSLLGRACMDVPEQPWGGWCCEEMGLGKTIEVLGLILANPAPPLPPGVHKDAKGLIKSRATLVVCAVSLVGQWIAEAQAKLTPGRLKIHMYHGQQRIRDPVRLATEFDLVVTTYATLGADYGGKRAGGQRANFPPLGAIKWHRLVLDEAHTVKNAAVAHTKASIALQADRRWMCTGTPINTDVSDLYGQFCVLGLSPFNNKTMFDSHAKNSYGNAYGSGCPALVYTLGQVMVRHTKRQVLGGEEVLRLPPKTEELVPVVLTAEEQEMYKKAHKASAELFAQYRTLGNHSINKHLLQIMALLLPMRRVCSGGNLRPRDLVVNDPLFGEGAVVRRRRLSGAGAIAPADHNLVAPEDECPICFDMPEAPVVTPCEHWFCRECILGVIATNPKCPLCRRAITAPDLRQGVTAAEADAEEAEAEAAAAAAKGGEGEAGAGEAPPAEQAFVSESKLQALLKELRKMRRTDPTAKALIFSQYVSTIEWLKTRLTQAGFEYRFLSGSMALKKRAKFIKEFQEAPPTTVFLLSMRSGAVGINLTAASHVFLMEPALNPALEEQAIGRAWRMGQQRSVKVFKFYVKGSVEERIMEVVRKRTEAVAGAAAAGPAAGGGGMSSEEEADEHGLGMGHGRGRGRWGYGERTNVRMQDLAGSIHADRQQLRVEELEVLFKAPEFPQPRVPEPDSQDDEADAAAAAAAIAAATAAHQQRRAGGAAAASRKPGRRPQRAAAAAGSDEGSDSEGAGGRAGLALGRGARRRSALRRPINYAELDGASLDSDDGEEEQEEQRPVGRRRGSRRRYSGDSDEEEWAPAGDTRDQSPGSLETSGLAEEEDEDFAEEEADEEEEAEAEGKEEAEEASRERVRAGSRSKRKRAGSTAAAAAAPAANGAAHRGAAVPTSRIKQVITRKSWGPGGAPKQQAEQQQQPADKEQQQEQHQQAATGSAGPSSRPGSSSGRLSPGWAARPFSAGTGAEAPAAATGGPAAAAAGAAPQHTPRVRVPMRGARLPAALTAHLAGGSAGRGAAPSGATPAQTGDQ